MKSTSVILISVSIAMLVAGCETTNSVNRSGYSLDNPQGGTPSRYGYLGVGGVGEGSQGSNQASPGPNRYGAGSGGGTTRNSAPVTSGDGPSNSETPRKPNGSGTSTATRAKESDDRPYADPVPGKYGRVYSPFAKGKEIDVADFPPGTLVRCPYTQKIFRVP
ncbi:MAG: hypothetical protein GY899_16275 [Verrucomicrobiaceae bacterium]|nr:hypothetical protein [Verrucomicrobiaceae bacterium]